MLGVLYGGSGDASAEQRFKFLFEKNQRFADTFVLPENLPSWLTEQDLNFFHRAIQTVGFPRRHQLVPQHRSELGADAVPRRRKNYSTHGICRRRSRHRDGNEPGRIQDARN